ASFRAHTTSIVPAGFKDLPKDPLKDVEFVDALPSPPFSAAKLDAVRPFVNALNLRVKPIVDGIAIESAPRPAPELRPAAAPPPAPVVIVTQAPPQPPPSPEVVEVPVPVAVPAGVVLVSSPPREIRRTEKSPLPTSAAPPQRRRDK